MTWKLKILTIAELVDALRVVPRIMLMGYSVLVWSVVDWFMGIPAPTSQHTALVVAVVGIIAPVAAFYQSSGRNWGNKDNRE